MLLPTYNSRMINAAVPKIPATPTNPAGPPAAAALTPSLTRSSAYAPLTFHRRRQPASRPHPTKEKSSRRPVMTDEV
ncbi:unnamed protein product [Sphagnum troendelagicum]|uniref:Uncharacterized protein n=1 Tax=Sphagnum troendelagicum TaxID=128251 RepID=A0ABP0U9B8_9BRYO